MLYDGTYGKAYNRERTRKKKRRNKISILFMMKDVRSSRAKARFVCECNNNAGIAEKNMAEESSQAKSNEYSVWCAVKRAQAIRHINAVWQITSIVRYFWMTSACPSASFRQCAAIWCCLPIDTRASIIRIVLRSIMWLETAHNDVTIHNMLTTQSHTLGRIKFHARDFDKKYVGSFKF